MLQDSDCEIELWSSICGQPVLMIQSGGKSANNPPAVLSPSKLSPEPKSNLQPPRRSTMTSLSMTPIQSMHPPRRFKSISADREVNFEISAEDRVFMRLHRQAACIDLKVSERRRECQSPHVSKDDVKKIFESLKV